MTSMFDTAVRNRSLQTPWARVSIPQFMREMLHNAPYAKQCPKCHGPVEPITYPEDSYLNRDQWESQRAGDYLCRACPGNDRGKNPALCYWWEREVLPRPAEHATVLRVEARHDVASREWWTIEWTSEDGQRSQTSASRLDLCLWRAAEHEMVARARAEAAREAAKGPPREPFLLRYAEPVTAEQVEHIDQVTEQ